MNQCTILRIFLAYIPVRLRVSARHSLLRLHVMKGKPKPVALVSMPSLSARHPSFQLALLKPMLEQAGISAQQFSFFMYMGHQVGWRIAETVADVWPCLVGEWIWSKSAFGEQANTKDEEYFAAYGSLFETICHTADVRSMTFGDCARKLRLSSLIFALTLLTGTGLAWLVLPLSFSNS